MTNRYPHGYAAILASWLVVAWLCSAPTVAHTQYLTGVAARWSDNLAEWIIYTEYDDLVGDLTRRTSAQPGVAVWDYRVGEQSGVVRLRWNANPLEWEVRGDNRVVTARALWRDSPRDWRITLPTGATFNWRSRYGNILSDWKLDETDQGGLGMYTYYESDPRDWVIIDGWETALPEKLLLVVITLESWFK